MSGMSDLNRQRIDRSKRRWVAAKLKTQDEGGDNKLYKVKVRSKGDRAMHVASFDEMSFKVDIKGAKRFDGMEEFSIQRPIIRNYGWELLINSVAEQLGLMSPQITPINFYFNGDNRGIYFAEEAFGSEFLERRGRKVGPIFSLNEPMGEKFPNVIYEAYELKKINSDNEIIYDNARIKLLELKKTYADNSFNPSLYFDLKKWAYYFSVIDLFGSYHGAVPKSVKLYFNPSSQLFEPIFFDNHLGGRGYSKFSLMDFKYINDYLSCGMACEYSEWFDIFFKDEEFFELYTKVLSSVMDRYQQGDFDDLINQVEIFNNAMYSSFAPADRVFYSSILLYHFDITYLDERVNMLRNKLNEYVGLSLVKNMGGSYIAGFTNQYYENTLMSNLLLLNDYCNKRNLGKCSPDKLKFIHMNNFSLLDEEFKIPDDTVLILSGDTNIKGSTLTSSKKGAMIVQVGGKFLSENSIFESLSNIYVAGTNWSGAINLINSNVVVNNISINNTAGEDALNFVESRVKSTGFINFNNIPEDALDGDNIDITFDNISCVNVGNDCLDTSSSKIAGLSVIGRDIGDKLVSFGEESNAKLNLVECVKCGIGITVKDSSIAIVDGISFDQTPLELAVFQKKRFFGPAKLVVNNSNQVSLINTKRLIGLGSILSQNGRKILGDLKSKDIKNMMYGNQYGRASNR